MAECTMRYMFHLVQQRSSQPLGVEAEGTARAPAETVWHLVSDATTYPQWGPWSDGGFNRPGDPSHDGAGAVRWFRYGRTKTVEEVLAAEAGKRLSYTVIGGIPVRNYLAEVTLTPVPGGTHIRWSARWDRTIGGRFVHRALSRFYPEMMQGLIQAAEQSQPVSP
jgi:uncharacterized protein YndB with AHSA1/START domain